MARLIYPIRPVQHAISVDNPSLFSAQGFSPWVSNGRIDQGSFKKRWGYSLDRTLARRVYAIVLYQTVAGTRYTVYLTDTDLCKKETSTGKTFSYQTAKYNTGSITNITGAVVTGSGTLWDASGLAAGDKFILTTDQTADEEPDTNWATIQTVDGATQITLTGNYTGTTGAFAPAKSYTTRMVYSVPSNERWSHAIVGDKFCFTNGDTNVQYYDGSTTSDLNTTYATKARYCIEYANRLFLGDLYVSGNRSPLTLMWSAEGAPTVFDPAVNATAGSQDLLETDDYIFGLGKVGFNLVVYKQNNILVFSRTGNATDPIRRTSERRGIGCVAPYSIVEFMGTNAFVGREDFYVMNGDQPESIGEAIREDFFGRVGYTEVERVFGSCCPNLNEIYWTANTTNDGQITYCYNYKYREWYTYQFAGDMNAFGRGAA